MEDKHEKIYLDNSFWLLFSGTVLVYRYTGTSVENLINVFVLQSTGTGSLLPVLCIQNYFFGFSFYFPPSFGYGSVVTFKKFRIRPDLEAVFVHKTLSSGSTTLFNAARWGFVKCLAA
jgi:hypothetical protein